jgi:hypothetical protein
VLEALKEKGEDGKVEKRRSCRPLGGARIPFSGFPLFQFPLSLFPFLT